MHRKRHIYIILIFSFLVSGQLLYAQDAPPAEPESPQSSLESEVLNVELPVDGLLQWQKLLDINGLDEGTYNLLITAYDRAGNVFEAPAIDLRIDPESDLPRADFTYPLEDMRISGDLTVLGSAGDDDAVDAVELRLNDGEFRRVEGRDYWSLAVALDELADGRHTLSARARDINGLYGEETSISFVLNREAPFIELSSPQSGDLLSGRLSLEGLIRDDNGIGSLRYSLDNGESWLEAPVRGRGAEAGFSANIDSRDLAEGPLVIRLEAFDAEGARGEESLLVYIDNTAPEILLSHPLEGEPENGSFLIAGSASDDNGIAFLGWTPRGGEESEIVLQAGNPYWSTPLSLQNGDRVRGRFRVLDQAGNQTILDLDQPLNVDGDKPVVLLSDFEEGMMLDEPLIRGWLADDDGPAALHWSIDRGEESRMETLQNFSLDLSGLSPGEHSIRLYAEDVYGVLGDPIQHSFFLLPAAPDVELLGISGPEGSLEYRAGMRFRSDEYTLLNGRVRFDGGAGTVSLRLPGGVNRELRLERTDEPGVFSFSSELTEPVPYGFVVLELSAIDALGSESLQSFPLWIEDLTQLQEPVGFARDRRDRVVLAAADSYEIPFLIHGLAQIDDSEIPSFLSLERRDSGVVIRGNSPGSAGGLVLKGTSDRGSSFEIPLPEIIVDLELPRIELEQDYGPVISRNETIRGRIIDDTEVLSLEARLDGGEWTSVSFQPSNSDKGQFSFSYPLDSSTLSPQGSILQFRAQDLGGNIQSFHLPIMGHAPAEESPRPGIKLLISMTEGILLPADLENGQLSLGIALQGVDAVNSLSLSLNEGAARTIRDFPVAKILLPSPGPGSHSIRVDANYGEDRTLSASLRFEIAGPRGGLVPGNAASGAIVVRGSGENFDINWTGSGQLDEALLSLDNNEASAIRLSSRDGGSFFPIPLENLKAGRHDYLLSVRDVHGRTSELEGFFFLTESPQDRSINAREGLYALDADDASKGYFFNGRDISTAVLEPEDSGITVSVEESILTLAGRGYSGDRTLKLSTIDGEEFSIELNSLSFDRTSPVLELTTPGEQQYLNRLSISGHVSDDDSLEWLAYRIQDGSYVEISLETGSGSLADTETSQQVGEGDTGGAAAEPGSFSVDIADSQLPQGPFVLGLLARDASGNETLIERLLVGDRQAPEARAILPGTEGVNGRTTLIYKVSDDWSAGIAARFVLGEELQQLESVDGFLSIEADFSPYQELPQESYLELEDQSGNNSRHDLEINFDPEADKPRVSIQFPEENRVFQSDAVFSGTVVDDDGVQTIMYRLDGGDFLPVDGSGSFKISIPFEELTDNEHLLEVMARDIYGVESEILPLPFRVSRDAPQAILDSPVLGSTNSGTFSLVGNASDANGIDKVFVSLDGGNSYLEARGAEEWDYPLDSSILVDGSYMLLIKARDKYGVESISSSLLRVDNSPPVMELSLPAEGESFALELPLQLRVRDELEVTALRYSLHSLDSDFSQESDLEVREVVLEKLDISDLEPGLYNLSIFATDGAGNESVTSRDFYRRKSSIISDLAILYPLEGAELSGAFSLEGRVQGDRLPETLAIFRNDQPFGVVEVGPGGYFHLDIEPGTIADGNHEFRVRAAALGTELDSNQVRIAYTAEGPWVRFDSLRTGTWSSRRPWIEGRAGYFVAEDSVPADLSPRQLRELEASRRLSALAYSLDGGNSFTDIRPDEQWRFRLETQDLDDGQLDVMMRARFADGRTAVSRLYTLVDDTPPQLSVVTPRENTALNEQIMVSGTAFDASGLESVTVTLRPRSKNSYELPQFIQGLYIDAHVLGATYWEAGLGLTFFDNNVKLQVLAGQAPPGRFNGTVLGLKLLANVGTLPYGYFFGPDWEFLSSSLAVGSAFQYFTMDNSQTDQEGLVLGAVIVQLELLKAEIAAWTMFNAYSIYVENQFWFISSDIQGGIEYRMAFGIRSNVF